MSALLLIGMVGGVYGIFAVGPAYWDDSEVHSILRQAANECMRTANDESIRAFVLKKMHDLFDVPNPGPGRSEPHMSVEVDPGDIQIQWGENPRYVNIWVTYTRKVTLPLIGQERVLTFTDHAEQDLTPVKW